MTDDNRAVVVMIHGLARTEHSMRILAMRLRRAGLRTHYARYASRRSSIEEASVGVARQIARLDVPDAIPLHLVGHSLGGILALRLKYTYPELNINRVVQLGSPNSGSGVARILSDTLIGREVFGPVIQELAEEPGMAWAPDPDVLAFAGTLFPPAISRQLGLRGASDGLVSSRSAWGRAAGHRRGADTFHGWMPLSSDVAEEVVEFLKTGKVARDDE